MDFCSDWDCESIPAHGKNTFLAAEVELRALAGGAGRYPHSRHQQGRLAAPAFVVSTAGNAGLPSADDQCPPASSPKLGGE